MVLAQAHKVHIVVRRIGKGQVYDDSIVPTAGKIFSDPMGIVAEYEKSGFSTGILYEL